MNKFYELKQNDTSAELLIYGDITSLKWFESDVASYDFVNELSGIKNDLTVRINSYGGEVKEGLAMYNALRAFSEKHKVTTVCEGYACSAASVVFMAGDVRVMPETSLLMIHNAWTETQGNADELRKMAADLEKVTQPSIDIYSKATGLSESEIKKMMDEETWLNANDALRLGFATEIKPIEYKQSINCDYYLRKEVEKNKALEAELTALKNKEKESHCKHDAWADFFSNSVTD